MATRSCIGIKHGDVIKSVYCHWDGYLDHNGKILLENYKDPFKVQLLIFQQYFRLVVQHKQKL